MMMPLWAEGDLVGPVGWVLGATTVLGAVGTLALSIINARHKNRQETEAAGHKAKQERDASAVTYMNGMLDRQEKQLSACGEQIRALTAKQAENWVREQQCLQDLAEQRATSIQLYEALAHLHAQVMRGERPTEPLPPRPEARPPRSATVPEEFALRNREHEAGLVVREGQELADRTPL